MFIVTMVSSLLYMAFVVYGMVFGAMGAVFIVTMVNFIWVEGQLKSIAG